MSSDSANIILSMSIKDDVYSNGERRQVFRAPLLKCYSYRMIVNMETVLSCGGQLPFCAVSTAEQGYMGPAAELLSKPVRLQAAAK